MLAASLRATATAAALAGLALPETAFAGGLVRDAEIEDTIRAYATPVFGAAGLDVNALRIHIVNDGALNAFVAGGQQMFIHTGLLMASDNPRQIIGVIAHETGHIAGGHLARSQEALRNASTAAIVAFVLGAAAMVGGKGDVGAATILGGTQTAQATLFQYSRTQESAADQAAANYLERSQQSTRGLLEMLQKLSDTDLGPTSSSAAYGRTHPLARERIAFLQTHVQNSRYSDAPTAPELVDRHARLLAKLHGFLDQPGRTFRRYAETDSGIPARYARTIAHHRQGNIDDALRGADGLIAAEPNNPFFHELRAQILFERGRVAESIPSYAQARKLKPDSPLLAALHGTALVASEDPANLKPAVEALESAARNEPLDALTWYQLSIAYGRLERFGEAALAAAERALLNGDFVGARDQARRAMGRLKEGTPGWLRSQDIEGEALRLRRLQRGEN
jgi:predicted Zn-dependent protease